MRFRNIFFCLGSDQGSADSVLNLTAKKPNSKRKKMTVRLVTQRKSNEEVIYIKTSTFFLNNSSNIQIMCKLKMSLFLKFLIKIVSNTFEKCLCICFWSSQSYISMYPCWYDFVFPSEFLNIDLLLTLNGQVDSVCWNCLQTVSCLWCSNCLT